MVFEWLKQPIFDTIMHYYFHFYGAFNNWIIQKKLWPLGILSRRLLANVNKQN